MPLAPPVRVLLLDREDRRITNVDALAAAAAAASRAVAGAAAAPRGAAVRVARFEGMPVYEQVAVAACADVFVGVHGAGMQLVSLVGTHSGGGGRSGALELSHAAHGTYYVGHPHTNAPGRLGMTLGDEQRVDNATTFSLKVAAGTTPGTPYPDALVIKWSDVRVDVGRFTDAIRKLVAHVVG